MLLQGLFDLEDENPKAGPEALAKFTWLALEARNAKATAKAPPEALPKFPWLSLTQFFLLFCCRRCLVWF